MSSEMLRLLFVVFRMLLCCAIWPLLLVLLHCEQAMSISRRPLE